MGDDRAARLLDGVGVCALGLEERTERDGKGNSLPFLFFVVPGSRRTRPAWKSTCRHCIGSTSLFTR